MAQPPRSGAAAPLTPSDGTDPLRLVRSPPCARSAVRKEQGRVSAADEALPKACRRVLGEASRTHRQPAERSDSSRRALLELSCASKRSHRATNSSHSPQADSGISPGSSAPRRSGSSSVKIATWCSRLRELPRFRCLECRAAALTSPPADPRASMPPATYRPTPHCHGLLVAPPSGKSLRAAR